MKYFAFLLLLCVSSLALTQEVNVDHIKAKIDIEKKEDGLKITGIANNLSNVSVNLTYKLRIKKTGANTSSNNQGGEVFVNENSSESLAVVEINYGKRDIIYCSLQVFLDDKLVAETSTQFPSKAATLDNIYSDGLQLNNFVIDETKTKFGKDFFDFFYSNFNLRYRNVKQTIRVEEVPFFARTTKISVFVGNDLIYEIQSQPNLEYLEEKAKESLSYLDNYLRTSQYTS